MNNLTKYSKFIVVGVGVVIAILTRHYGAGSELVQDLVLIATAVGVYSVPNTVPSKV